MMQPKPHHNFFYFSKNMTSQGSSSAKVFSLISDVTYPDDEISDDANTYFENVTLPETGKIRLISR
jgi:hypothetical protein